MARNSSSGPPPHALSSGPVPPVSPSWQPGPKHYQLALDPSSNPHKLICRNAKGVQLSTVPREVRESPQAQALITLAEWLDRHSHQCCLQAEQWMLRSLPIPTALIAAVWPDPAWQQVLANCVVIPCSASGDLQEASAGILMTTDPSFGLGLLTLDGETLRIRPAELLIPHPILLPELVEWRELSQQLGFHQHLEQLSRQTTAKSLERITNQNEEARLDRFSGVHFEQLAFAQAACRSAGFRVRGGYATTRVFEAGTLVEARFWIGMDDPTWETDTEDLVWVDAEENSLTFAQVGPVAWSEGIRMAAAIASRGKALQGGADEG